MEMKDRCWMVRKKWVVCSESSVVEVAVVKVMVKSLVAVVVVDYCWEKELRMLCH